MRESQRHLTIEEDAVRPRCAGGSRRVRIELLDGEYINVDIDRKARGGDLLDRVCESLEIIEKDFFGLLHTQRGDPRVWVNLTRRLSKTFKNEPWDVRLAVKFYPPEPSELIDDTTRYHLCLAVRADLVEGRLRCSAHTHALLVSYAVQAERGDRAARPARPAQLPSAPAPAPLALLTPHLREQIDHLHEKHKGQTPAEAELNYLENAKKLPLYGAELHNAKDSDGIDITIAVNAHGISVYREDVQMNRFPWAMMTKIAYNKRSFSLRLRAAPCDDSETELLFSLPGAKACKKLWTCSVEHHVFFRRAAPVRVSRAFPRLGARRLSCRRTLRQARAANALASAID